ncbi:MAG TPA: hypothetical protein VIJ34_14750 [Acidimicrobiales bacterium]
MQCIRATGPNAATDSGETSLGVSSMIRAAFSTRELTLQAGHLSRVAIEGLRIRHYLTG